MEIILQNIIAQDSWLDSERKAVPGNVIYHINACHILRSDLTGEKKSHEPPLIQRLGECAAKIGGKTILGNSRSSPPQGWRVPEDIRLPKDN